MEDEEEETKEEEQEEEGELPTNEKMGHQDGVHRCRCGMHKYHRLEHAVPQGHHRRSCLFVNRLWLRTCPIPKMRYCLPTWRKSPLRLETLHRFLHPLVCQLLVDMDHRHLCTFCEPQF